MWKGRSLLGVEYISAGCCFHSFVKCLSDSILWLCVLFYWHVVMVWWYDRLWEVRWMDAWWSCSLLYYCFGLLPTPTISHGSDHVRVMGSSKGFKKRKRKWWDEASVFIRGNLTLLSSGNVPGMWTMLPTLPMFLRTSLYFEILVNDDRAKFISSSNRKGLYFLFHFAELEK